LAKRFIAAAAALLSIGIPCGGAIVASSIAATDPTVPGARNCSLFPPSNVWNRTVTSLPVAKNSAQMIKTIGPSIGLHPDFGSDPGNGIPYNVVGRSTPMARVAFHYSDQSDKEPYPIPAHPKIEGGSDRHMIMVDKARCKLYELFAVNHTRSGWRAGSGAIWSLKSNKLRPDTWTSADAAGLPILPGLVRYDEVAAGAINHALRFTVPVTRSAHIYPARHDAGSGNDPTLPPMGLRLRLEASVSIAGLSREDRVILTALKKYGMIVADNGGPWFITGAPDPRWNDDTLHVINRIHGSDFQVVDTSRFRNGKG
jgi:hypothetical protein